MIITTTCKQCGKEFRDYACKGRQFCSPKCTKLYRKNYGFPKGNSKMIENYSLKDEELNEYGVFSLITNVISTYFDKKLRIKNVSSTIRKGNKYNIKNKLIRAMRPFEPSELRFVDSKILSAWCDCSSNFEAEKLKKRILTKVASDNLEFSKELTNKLNNV